MRTEIKFRKVGGKFMPMVRKNPQHQFQMVRFDKKINNPPVGAGLYSSGAGLYSAPLIGAGHKSITAGMKEVTLDDIRKKKLLQALKDAF